MGPSPHPWFCSLTTATLWPELIVSIGPRPHLSFVCMQNSRDWHQKSLVSHGSQPSSVDLCMQNSDWLGSRITNLYRSQTFTYVFFAFKTAPLAPELHVSLCPCPHLWFSTLHNSVHYDPELTVISMGPSPSTVVLCMQNSVTLAAEITSLHMCPRLHLSFCACKPTWLYHQNYYSLWVPDLHLWFLICKTSDFWIRITTLYGTQTSSVDLRMQNSLTFRSWMTLVYWSHPSSVVLCIQNSDFSIRITGIYGTQPSFVASECKTATLESELEVSMGPRPHLWFFAFKTATLEHELQVSMGPRPHHIFIIPTKQQH